MLRISFVIILAACAAFGAPGNDDSGGRKFQFESVTVADSFALLRYDEHSGMAWFHNDRDSWQPLVPGESLPPADYDFEVVRYFKPIHGVSTKVVAGGSVVTTEEWTCFRMDKATGETWVYEKGAFNPISVAPTDNEGAPDSVRGPFRMASLRLDGGFALLRVDQSTGTVWTYANDSWTRLGVAEVLPKGSYKIELIAVNNGSRDAKDAHGFELFRIHEGTGQAWRYTAGEFRPVPDHMVRIQN